MSASGTVFWVLFKPLYVEGKDKSYITICDEYANFKYDVKKTFYF